MDIGLGTIVWVAIILIFIRYWKNIFNLIGGAIYLVAIVILFLFVILNFTNLPIERFVNLDFYDEIREDSGGYLVEKKDNAFESALEAKDSINSLNDENATTEEETTQDDKDNKDDTDNEGAMEEEDKGEEGEKGVENSKGVGKTLTNTSSIEESNINFNDESQDNTESESEEREEGSGTKEENGDNKEESKSTEGIGKEELVPYGELDDYLGTIEMREDTKNLVKNLSPYVTWEYDDGEWLVESTKEGVKLERK